MSYCENCGCKVYSGLCTNCDEESFIYYQNLENEETISFSDEFMLKVKEQHEKARKYNK